MAWLVVVPVLVWVYLIALRGQFWRTDVRLPTAPVPASWPSVAVIVPARDEADVLPGTLATLLAQDYPGSIRVVLVDDRSTDGTGDLARQMGAGGGPGGGRSVPLTVIAGEERPEGWAGKLWAVEQGFRRLDGRSADGPEWSPPCAGPRSTSDPGVGWILLTDADIAHPPDSVRRLVAWAEAGQLDQVSLMARLRVATGWERLLIPPFVYFFAQLYPFRWVNRTPGSGRFGSTGSRGAAAGGCMLVRRRALDRAGGVASVRDAVIDDVALARSLERTGATLWLGLADDVASIRPYPALREVWDMVSRSAFTQLRHSVVLLAATVAGLAVVYLGPPVALVVGVATGLPLVAGAGALSWLMMIVTYVPMVRYYQLAWWRALGLPVAACLYGAMTVTSAWRYWRGGVRWKGRPYGARS